MRICEIVDCTNKTRTRGQALCEKHYRRKQRHGDPTVTLRTVDTRSAQERWKDSYVIDEETGCWNWTGPKERLDGYGFITDGRENRYQAHRFVWERLVGPIPVGEELDHGCFNKGCVNPAHLESVPHKENVRRGGVNGSNFLKTYCDYGHEFTPENTYVRANGWRQCRACNRRIMREKKYRSAYKDVYAPGHPLAAGRRKAYVYEHRFVLYNSVGAGPHNCHWCGESGLEWGGIHGIHVDHINGEPSDNRLENLVVSCQRCNKSRAAAGSPTDWAPPSERAR